MSDPRTQVNAFAQSPSACEGIRVDSSSRTQAGDAPNMQGGKELPAGALSKGSGARRARGRDQGRVWSAMRVGTVAFSFLLWHPVSSMHYTCKWAKLFLKMEKYKFIITFLTRNKSISSHDVIKTLKVSPIHCCSKKDEISIGINL